MGYVIDYGTGQKSRFITGRSLLWAAFIFTVFCLIIVTCWEEGRQVLQTVLLPGDWEQAKLAGEDLIHALRGGESFPDAVSAFCREIIIHGN